MEKPKIKEVKIKDLDLISKKAMEESSPRVRKAMEIMEERVREKTVARYKERERETVDQLREIARREEASRKELRSTYTPKGEIETNLARAWDKEYARRQKSLQEDMQIQRSILRTGLIQPSIEMIRSEERELQKTLQKDMQIQEVIQTPKLRKTPVERVSERMWLIQKVETKSVQALEIGRIQKQIQEEMQIQKHKTVVTQEIRLIKTTIEKDIPRRPRVVPRPKPRLKGVSKKKRRKKRRKGYYEIEHPILTPEEAIKADMEAIKGAM